MKLNFVWLMSMLGLLFLANTLMALGYYNTQFTLVDSFVEEHFLNPAPVKETFLNPAPSAQSGEYQAIGAYDNLMKKPAHGKSEWRETAPDEPLRGPEVPLDGDHLFMFANNQAKPECCGASYATSTGCVCTTPGQRNFLAARGGNATTASATV